MIDGPDPRRRIAAVRTSGVLDVPQRARAIRSFGTDYHE